MSLLISIQSSAGVPPLALSRMSVYELVSVRLVGDTKDMALVPAPIEVGGRAMTRALIIFSRQRDSPYAN